MGKVFACFSIALHNFKKWAVNPRLYILLLMEVLYLHSRLSPVGELCARTGYKVTPYLLPFLLDEGSAVMMLFLGVVLLFCDAPFIEDEQPYIMLRSGRRIWFIGQRLYIVVASVLYLIVLYFISVLVLLPHIEWSAEWGKLLSTFSQTSAAGQNGISIPFARVITARFDPIPAVLRCVVNGSLVATVLGMLMFFVNLNISRTAGGICGTALVLWNMVTYKTWYGFVNVSPVSWVNLSRVDYDGSSIYPSLTYILLALLALFAALSAASWVTLRRRNIDVLKSV